MGRYDSLQTVYVIGSYRLILLEEPQLNRIVDISYEQGVNDAPRLSLNMCVNVQSWTEDFFREFCVWVDALNNPPPASPPTSTSLPSQRGKSKKAKRKE